MNDDVVQRNCNNYDEPAQHATVGTTFNVLQSDATCAVNTTDILALLYIIATICIVRVKRELIHIHIENIYMSRILNYIPTRLPGRKRIFSFN